MGTEVAAVMFTPGGWRIIVERARQIEKEGWTDVHDDEHPQAVLLDAAVAYAETAKEVMIWNRRLTDAIPSSWPWDEKWWKPSEDPIRNLEKAGALIAAEIDRLLRLRQRDQVKTEA